MTKQNDDRPHYIYRCYDKDGALLYIGCSIDPTARIKSHRSTSAFGLLVDRMRVTGPFPGWEYAHRVELAAVWEERPLYNCEGAHPEALPFARRANAEFTLARHLRLIREGRRAA